MAVPTILGRSLRFVPKNGIYSASKYGLQVHGPCLLRRHRQLSQFNRQYSTDTDQDTSTVPASDGPSLAQLMDYRVQKWTTSLYSPKSPIVYRPRLLKIHRSCLRDACTCERCVDPSSGQKRFSSADVPSDLDIQNLGVAEDGSLQVYWKRDFFTGDTHVSTYPSTIFHIVPPPPVRERVTTSTLWSSSSLKNAPIHHSFESFMAGGPEYVRAMTMLHDYGLIFLRGLPSSETAVEDLASKIGTMQETFYGRTWDVRSKPEAENVAYTDSYLGLHQDLLYMNNVPRIQLLHCLENTCTGGESFFRDGFLAAHTFRLTFPQFVKPLERHQVLYHYTKGGNTYRTLRQVIRNRGLWWSPPFQSPVQPDMLTTEGAGLWAKWHAAVTKLKQVLEDPNGTYEFKMTPGDCVIFDNRRILHGRRAFNTSSGERWLKGTYVDNDSYMSRLRTLKIGPDIRMPKPVEQKAEDGPVVDAPM
ncbi:hypothetical protein ONZ43_g6153 [Nemania bipapillata]|uniref:Uncharacterized protein n=1 Tax=Nemania bipapillata TaxID=110536 RepID=A0ACC2I3N3_9PEZI|nr:hypothetical protein ONZ43_g6153 [Nemania bipapillata]